MHTSKMRFYEKGLFTVPIFYAVGLWSKKSL